MTKFRRKPRSEDKSFSPLVSDVTDDWGKPLEHANPSETALTTDNAPTFKHARLAHQKEVQDREARLTPTQSCAEFFKALDSDYQPGRIISRGRIVGRIGSYGRRR